MTARAACCTPGNPRYGNARPGVEGGSKLPHSIEHLRISVWGAVACSRFRERSGAMARCGLRQSGRESQKSRRGSPSTTLGTRRRYELQLQNQDAGLKPGATKADGENESTAKAKLTAEPSQLRKRVNRETESKERAGGRCENCFAVESRRGQQAGNRN